MWKRVWMAWMLWVVVPVWGWLEPEFKGRFDVGPAYFNVAIQENGKTRNHLDMVGGRFDATLLFFKNCGLCLKPYVFGGQGGGHLFSGGCGIGHYTPVNDKLSLIPVVGRGYANLSSFIDLDHGQAVIPHVKERFRSWSSYVGIDAVYSFNEKWCLTLGYLYAWASTHTTLSSDLLPFKVKVKGRSQGPIYSAMLDYYFYPNWSVTAGVAANSSLDKEKFGIEGFGARFGLSYTFKP